MNKDRDVGERSPRLWFALSNEENWSWSIRLQPYGYLGASALESSSFVVCSGHVVFDLPRRSM